MKNAFRHPFTVAALFLGLMSAAVGGGISLAPYFVLGSTTLTLGATTTTVAGLTLTSPTFTTPILGTPQSGVLTNATGLPISTGVSGLGTSVATALAVNVGSAGAPVVLNGALGTPSSGTLTNATGLPATTGITGTLPIANGGTNDTGTAWTTYSPAVTCGQATGTAICTGAGRYKMLGKTVWLTFNVTTSGTFTAGTITSVALPNAAVNGTTFYNCFGRENNVTGVTWIGSISAGASIVGVFNYANANAILTGESINLTCTYETA